MLLTCCLIVLWMILLDFQTHVIWNWIKLVFVVGYYIMLFDLWINRILSNDVDQKIFKGSVKSSLHLRYPVYYKSFIFFSWGSCSIFGETVTAICIIPQLNVFSSLFMMMFFILVFIHTFHNNLSRHHHYQWCLCNFLWFY